MVRLKQRYLLLNILYPNPASNPQTQPQTTTSSSVAKPTTTNPQPSYLTFYAPTPQHFSPQLFLSTLRSQISLLYGDYGLGSSQSSLKVVYFSHATSTIILRVPRGSFRLVWAALSFLQGIPAPFAGRGERGGRERRDGGGAAGKEIGCVVRVVRVSGTIRKIEEELLRRGRREIVRAKMMGQGEVEGPMHVEEGGIGDEDEDVDEEEEEDE